MKKIIKNILSSKKKYIYPTDDKKNQPFQICLQISEMLSPEKNDGNHQHYSSLRKTYKERFEKIKNTYNISIHKIYL